VLTSSTAHVAINSSEALATRPRHMVASYQLVGFGVWLVCGLINVGQAFSPVYCACMENGQARMPVLLVTGRFLVR
jgi:hypothetical protein